MTYQGIEYKEIPDTDNKDCDICELPASGCQYPYCERNKIVFKKV